jgi:15-cis-phytoene synthase
MPDRPDLSPARSLALLYSSTAQRAALAALTALECEIGASLRPGLDHQLAHTRLAWWREECARTAQGRATHPLTRELTTLFPQAGTEPLAGLGGLVDMADWDLARATFATRPELTAYCERWSGALIVPLAWLATPGGAAAQAIALGAGLHEIELLLALAADARAGRLRLPLDELEAAHLAPQSLAQPPWPPPLAELLRRRHGELRAALGTALDALEPAVRPALRGLIVWATLAGAASARAEQRLPRESGPHDHHAPLDGWRAWRAARRVDTQPKPTPETRRVRAP